MASGGNTPPGLGNRPRPSPSFNPGLNPREATRIYHEKMGRGRSGLALCFVVMCVHSECNSCTPLFSLPVVSCQLCTARALVLALARRHLTTQLTCTFALLCSVVPRLHTLPI